MLGSSWVAERLAVSQEGLSAMQLVILSWNYLRKNEIYKK
jgi:hypothetical protein